MDTRSYLKKVFFPNLCVRPSFQVLDILEYACGLKLGPALTLSQNPIFEMASSELNFKMLFYGGEGGIRTHDPVFDRIPLFESGALSRSATSPKNYTPSSSGRFNILF
jgi:hypothetical protein